MAKPDALLRVGQRRAAFASAKDVKTIPALRISRSQLLE